MTGIPATVTLIAFVLLAGQSASADWTLDNNASELSFISIKAGDVGEVHRFSRIDGGVDDSGNATVTIQLASVETLIPIRDERMRDILFETGLFPTATLSTHIDPKLTDELMPGDSQTLTAEITLDLHGASVPLTMELAIARLSDSRVLVSSLKPVIVNAGVFDLANGIEELRELAGLPAISKAVPVSFVLMFVEME